MKTRLIDMLKTLAILGLGLGAARWASIYDARHVPLVMSMDGGGPHPSFRQKVWLLVTQDARPALAGIGWIGGLFVLFDRAWRRPPGRWGGGRWVLAAVALLLTLFFALSVAGESVRRLRFGMDVVTAESVLGNLAALMTHTIDGRVVAALTAGWIASHLAGWPRDPAPDLTEWGGRVLLLLMILIIFGFDMLT